MAREPLAARVTELTIRFLYLAAAVALVWVSREAGDSLRFWFNQNGTFHLASWLLLAAAGILTGIMVGIGIKPFDDRARGYRWGVAATLAAVPALFVTVEAIALSAVGSHSSPPRWLWELYLIGGSSLFGPLLGLAIMAGFTARAPE